MRGDRVEIVAVGLDGRAETCVVSADRAGRCVEMVTENGIVRVREVNRQGRPLRGIAYPACQVVRLVEHFHGTGDCAPIVVRPVEEPVVSNAPGADVLAETAPTSGAAATNGSGPMREAAANPAQTDAVRTDGTSPELALAGSAPAGREAEQFDVSKADSKRTARTAAAATEPRPTKLRLVTSPVWQPWFGAAATVVDGVRFEPPRFRQAGAAGGKPETPRGERRPKNGTGKRKRG